MNNNDKDYPPKSGLLPQYENFKGMTQCMPIIRKLLGISEYGRIPTDTFIGRAVQKFIDNDRKDVMCKSTTN